MSRLLRLAEATARAVACARQGRALHTRGRTFRATVRAFGGAESYGVAVLDRHGDHDALVRFSRGAGFPAGWPDVLGVAVRIFGGGGPSTDLDLLMSTTLGGQPLARHVPMLRRRFTVTYTTIGGYRTVRGRRYLAALPDPSLPDLPADVDVLTDAAATDRAGLLLAVASAFGGWRVWGRLTVNTPLPAEVDEYLAFDPLLPCVQGLRAEGPLWRLRDVTYRGSRVGRGVPEFAAAAPRGRFTTGEPGSWQA